MADIGYEHNIGSDHRIIQIALSASPILAYDGIGISSSALQSYLDANKINVLDGYAYSNDGAWSVSDINKSVFESIAKSEKYFFPFANWHKKVYFSSSSLSSVIIRLILDR